MSQTYRFYSFVAGLYLSPLQRGLQTGHAISEMHADLLLNPDNHSQRTMYDHWATHDKTIVICDALNSAGVVEAYHKLTHLVRDLQQLPVTIFHEDTASLNNAPTATGIIVPDYLFDARKDVIVEDSSVIKDVASELKALFTRVKPQSTATRVYRYEKKSEAGEVLYSAVYGSDSAEYAFIDYLKSFRLAQS
jgi:hypothetical protein